MKKQQKKRKIKDYIISYKVTDKKRVVIAIETLRKLLKEAKIANKEALLVYDIKTKDDKIKLEIIVKEGT